MVRVVKFVCVIVLCILAWLPPWSAASSGTSRVVIAPAELRPEDLAAFHRIHWHAFDCVLPEAPEAIGYDLLLYADGEKTVIPGLWDRSASARTARHRFTVLYRESPDRVKLDLMVTLDGLCSYETVDNPFAGLDPIILKSTTVGQEGTVVLAVVPGRDDERVDLANIVPEAAYRCLAIRIRTERGDATMDFKTRQKQLFYEIDHKAVYDACQELMRLRREGKLAASAFHCDDPAEKLVQVPQAIRVIEPTSIAVDESMVTLMFLSGGRTQHLQCYSNEFGEPRVDEGTKGSGFRVNPYAMDKLTGDESLDSLNETYVHFGMNLIPGLRYEFYAEETPDTLEAVKQSDESLAGVSDMVRRMATVLAVKRQRLLHRVDHQKLLEACRETIRRYNQGVFSAAEIFPVREEFKEETDTLEYERSEKDTKHVPELILSLEPGYLWFTDNSVMVAIAGGLDHAGVIAYAEGVEEEELRDDAMRLIDGLVYYDDGLKEAGEDYREYLQSLRDEVLLYHDWSRKQMNLPIPKRSSTP